MERRYLRKVAEMLKFPRKEEGKKKWNEKKEREEGNEGKRKKEEKGSGKGCSGILGKKKTV